MTYQEYMRRCRSGQNAIVDDAWGTRSGPIERSEHFILRGDLRAARSAIADIQDPCASYFQAIKACRHFEDRSFITDGDPPPAAGDWALPLLRAACSVASERGDGERIERYAAASSRGRGPEAVRALMIVANAYRNTGDHESSARVLRQAFEFAPRVAPATPPPPKRGAELSFMKRRQSAFRDLVRAVDLKDRSLFPCSGTLLGLYRDQDFIPSDGDVDLGCLDPAGLSALKMDMRTSGRFYLSPGRLESNFNARHVSGVKFDVSLYVTREDGLAKTSHVYEWRFDRFSLADLATDYGRLPIPDATEQYLSAMYGDWWVPRSGYDSRIDSPNLVYVSPEEVALVLASHFLATYLAGGHEACAGWRRKFERLPGDAGVGVESFLEHLR